MASSKEGSHLPSMGRGVAGKRCSCQDAVRPGCAEQESMDVPFVMVPSGGSGRPGSSCPPAAQSPSVEIHGVGFAAGSPNPWKGWHIPWIARAPKPSGRAGPSICTPAHGGTQMRIAPATRGAGARASRQRAAACGTTLTLRSRSVAKAKQVPMSAAVRSGKSASKSSTVMLSPR